MDLARKRKSTRSPKLPSDQRRQQILDRALEVFAQKGYVSARTREIAAAAGVSEPALYRHFSSKKELYLGLLASLRDQLLAAHDMALTNAPDAMTALRLFGMEFYQFVTHSPETAIVIFQTFSELNIPEVRQYSRSLQLALHERITTQLERAIRDGFLRGDIDVDLTAWRFLSIGYTVSALSFMGLLPQFGPEKVLAWGDSLFATLAPPSE